MIPYEVPALNKDAFNCPICKAYSSQSWGALIHKWPSGGSTLLSGWDTCSCRRCGNYSLWHDSKMIFPDFGGVQVPNSDLGEDITNDYNEAAAILNKSPRGSAAILRLCLQKLCKLLGQKGDNINEDVAALVKKGLPIQIQQALDIVRVVGNNAVHPGQIDLRDNVNTATQMFALLNLIAETMITQPKRIEEFYSTLPLGAVEAINKRDKSPT